MYSTRVAQSWPFFSNQDLFKYGDRRWQIVTKRHIVEIGITLHSCLVRIPVAKVDVGLCAEIHIARSEIMDQGSFKQTSCIINWRSTDVIEKRCEEE